MEAVMLFRAVSVVVVALAVVLLISGPALAAEKTHEGKIVSVSKDKLTMTEKDGTNKHTHKVSADATITLDGKKAKLTELKEGQFVKVTFSDDADKTATKLEASTKEKK